MTLDDTTPSDQADRPPMQSINRGARGACPACGSKTLFAGFLAISHACRECGMEFHHHRADDFPAYLVVLVIGHILVGLAMIVQMHTDLSVWTHLAIWAPAIAIAALLSLRPVKGAVIGFQWALRMHGFGTGEDNDVPTSR